MAAKAFRVMVMSVPGTTGPGLKVVKAETPLLNTDEGSPVEIVNPEGSANILLICEHATWRIPKALGTLGLDQKARLSHIAWDPGAAAVAHLMSDALDAPLILQRFSRLVYDCNRPPESPGAMPARSEIFDIPGNIGLTANDRQARIDAIYTPLCETIATYLDRAQALGQAPAIVTLHSFTPIFHGRPRSVELGLLHDADARLADAMLDLGDGTDDLDLRRNEPYGPEDGVTHTLQLHALPRGLPNVMIEIRNDLIRDEAGQAAMAQRLAVMVSQASSRLATATARPQREASR